MVKFNFENSSIKESVINEYSDQVLKIHEMLHKKANDEKEFLGWIELPTNYDKEEFARIKKAAKKIQKDSDVLVVIGIGGSYLGARAVIDALTHSFYNGMPEGKRKKDIFEIYPEGACDLHHLSARRSNVMHCSCDHIRAVCRVKPKQ